MQMQDWLSQRAARSPERVALFFQGAQWTFRELDVLVSQTADALARAGIVARERVAVLMGNSDHYVVLVHALARLGAVLVPLNTRLTASEATWQVAHLRVRVLVLDEANTERGEQIAALTGVECVRAENLRRDAVARESILVPAPFDLDAPHSILFTSGTTGNPKGAVLTYGNHWWNAVGSALNLGLREDDVWLLCMPLFHVGGLAILLRSVIYGSPVILHPAFDAAAVNDAFDGQCVTIVSLVSTMLERVLNARGDRPFPACLRCILLGGGPAPQELLETCAARNVPVVQTYGLTETASQVATLAPADALVKLGSAGKPLMGVELSIDGQAQPGAVGEIAVRGPTVMREYADDSAATARAFRDGWFHTGDLGYFDREGFLYVLARRDDLIVSGGENIYPAEIESVLNQHPAVQESAVVGIADKRWIQVPVAYVVLRAGMNAEETELKTWCEERLARFKLPKRIHFVDGLPRNASGKLVRRALAAEET